MLDGVTVKKQKVHAAREEEKEKKNVKLAAMKRVNFCSFFFFREQIKKYEKWGALISLYAHSRP